MAAANVLVIYRYLASTEGSRVRETTRSWQIKVERHKKDWEIGVWYVNNTVKNKNSVKGEIRPAETWDDGKKHTNSHQRFVFHTHSSTVFLTVEDTLWNVILTYIIIPERYIYRHQTLKYHKAEACSSVFAANCEAAGVGARSVKPVTSVLFCSDSHFRFRHRIVQII
jgi:hypothetical protein